MTDYSEFDSVLSRYADGTLSAGELAELEARLIADPAFAEYVSRWCLMHRQIVELLNETKLHDLLDQFVQSSPGLPRGAFRQTSSMASSAECEAAGDFTSLPALEDSDVHTVHRVRASWTTKWRWLIYGASAAALIVAAGWWSKRDQKQAASDNRNAAHMLQGIADAPEKTPFAPALVEPQGNQPSDMIATLTQVADGVWAPGAPVLHHGQQLAKGSRVALASGMAKVTYDCGAEVVLQGPCDFVVQDSMLGYLAAGRITAHVPRRAFSFAILSPQVDFVDLGTSFGVDVGASGRTELHVFEGEVLCSQPQKQAAGRSDIIHVLANNAMEFTSSNRPPSGIAINEEQFSRLIALRRAADYAAGHLVEDKLALWLAADVAVTTDPADRVISWQDIVYGDNQSAEDAIQTDEDARPRLVADSINGHPALRFDGQSDYLLTTPLETTDDQTVLMVIQYSPSAYGKDRRWGGQILNYDGPPSRYLSNTLEPGVLQLGEPLLEEEFKPTLLTGQVFAGFIGSATVEAGRVDAMQVGANQPVVVAYVYDYEYEHGKSFLAINGRSYGEARAFAPQGITSRKIIGRHAWMQNYFHGDLAELLIFNKALSKQELADTTTYLAEKYSIPLDSQPAASREVSQ